MKIQVTKLDIDRGVQWDPRECPVSRAIRRTTGKKTVVSGEDTIRVGKTRYDTPEVVREFIFNFDWAGGDFLNPIEFELP